MYIILETSISFPVDSDISSNLTNASVPPPDHAHDLLEDIDPDLNVLHNQHKSLYYSSQSFNDRFFESHIPLSLFHLNIRSAQSNINSLTDFLTTLTINFSIFGLTETWLTDTNSSIYSIPGFTSVALNRQNRRGGGVMIQVREDLTFRERPDLNLLTEHCECIFIELIDFDSDYSAPPYNHSRNIVIGCLYRPPNANFDLFFDSLQSLLLNLKTHKNKTCYIMGDFNIQMMNSNSNSNTQAFLDLLYSNMFVPLIDRPTRITHTCSSLIDNIFCNTLSTHRTNGLFYTDISDHLPIFTLLEADPNIKKDITIKFRQFSSRNKESFKNMLANETWVDVFESNDVESCYDLFHAKMSLLFTNAFPMKTKTIKQHKRHKPWLTHELKQKIKYKNKLYRKFHKYPTLHNELEYKIHKRQTAKLLRDAEANYFQNQFNLHKTNMKKTWEVLNELMGQNKKNKSAIDELVTDQGTLCSLTEIAEALNIHFSTIGGKINSELPPSTMDPLSYLNETFTQSMFMLPATESEIAKSIINLKIGSPGPDQFPSILFKENADHLIQPITHLVNMSLMQGVVPSKLKQANVTPVPKGGAMNDANNFRPISVLNVISKILERIVYKRLLSYLQTNSILSTFQFGFRKNHSSEMALVMSTEFIRHSLDAGDNVLGVFLDLRKAFDVVPHDILLLKLRHYGIRGVPLQWFSSYLSDRKQSVKINQSVSSLLPVEYGVPQGSILGPLLFLIFINDLKPSTVADTTRLTLFADDTTLLVRSPHLATLATTVNNELAHLSSWFKANRMSVNANKTHYIRFSLKRQYLSLPVPIIFDNQELNCIPSTKFLGVVIDESLTWKNHVSYIASKICKSIGIIHKVRRLLTKETRIQLYNSLILPYLHYCLLIWGNAAITTLDRLFKLQKRAVRTLTCSDFKTHTQPLFTECNIIPFSCLYTYVCSIFIFKHVNSIYPINFCNDFKTLIPAPIQNRTRSIEKIRVPKFRTSFGQKSITFQYCKLFNEFLMPLELLKLSFPEFKKTLRQII